MTISDDELAYLQSERRLGVATAARMEHPRDIRVAWTFNAALETIDVGGRQFDTTNKKYGDVEGSGQASILSTGTGATTGASAVAVPNGVRAGVRRAARYRHSCGAR